MSVYHEYCYNHSPAGHIFVKLCRYKGTNYFDFRRCDTWRLSPYDPASPWDTDLPPGYELSSTQEGVCLKFTHLFDFVTALGNMTCGDKSYVVDGWHLKRNTGHYLMTKRGKSHTFSYSEIEFIYGVLDNYFNNYDEYMC